MGEVYHRRVMADAFVRPEDFEQKKAPDRGNRGRRFTACPKFEKRAKCTQEKRNYQT
jgi:hypothetical protein